MPSDAIFKWANSGHRLVQRLTGGKIGWRAAGMPVVELTTIGRKSGEPRTVLLTSPWQDGEVFALVASRGGDDHHPAWYFNIQANPDVEVRIGGGAKQPRRARVATAEERARIWPELTAKHANYAGYQRKTSREIPVVLVEPPTA